MAIPTGDNRQFLAETAAIRREIVDKVAQFVGESNELESALPGVNLIRRTTPSPATAYFYDPSLAITVSGRKRVLLGGVNYTYDASHFLLTSVNLPTTAEVLEATDEAPYVSILIKFDMALVRELMTSIDAPEPDDDSEESAMSLGPTSAELFDAARRLLNLLDKPQDVPHLNQLIQREITYRVLTSPAGAKLRTIVSAGTQSSRVSKAIGWLRDNFMQPVRIEDLASVAGMGASTLHHHFRTMTQMSPLQYQKQLRLHEARRLLLVEDIDVASAALRVGYESSTQFSREYRRQFGAPPMRDIKSLRIQPSA